MSINPDIFSKGDYFDDPRATKWIKEVMHHPEWDKKEIEMAKNEAEIEKIPSSDSPLAVLNETWYSLQKAWHTFQMQHDSRYQKSFHQAVERIQESAPPERASNTPALPMSKIAVKEAKQQTPIKMSRMKLDALPELRLELERVRIQTLQERAKGLQVGIKEKNRAIEALETYLSAKAHYDQELESLEKIKISYQEAREAYQTDKDKGTQKEILKLGAKITHAEESLRVKKVEIDKAIEVVNTTPLLSKLALEELSSSHQHRWGKEIEEAKVELEKVREALTKHSGQQH